MTNLVGETVRFSPQNKQEGGHRTRTIYISRELTQEGKRYYHVRDVSTDIYFYVIADIYDAYFLVKRSAVAAKNYKDKIHNTGNPDYTK